MTGGFSHMGEDKQKKPKIVAGRNLADRVADDLEAEPAVEGHVPALLGRQRDAGRWNVSHGHNAV